MDQEAPSPKITDEEAHGLAKRILQSYQVVLEHEHDSALIAMMKVVDRLHRISKEKSVNPLEALAMLWEENPDLHATDTGKTICLAAVYYVVEVEPTFSPATAKLMMDVAGLFK